MSKTSDLIRRLTKDFGLSQQEISRRTGIPQPRLSRWLSRGSNSADDALLLDALLKKESAKHGRKRAAA